MLLRLASLVLLLLSTLSAQDAFDNVKRVVALGDVHGDITRFTAILREAALMSADQKWTGGATHLVLCGDFIDRGPAAAKVLDLILKLEPQAQKAGGRVHALIGNHEAMNIYGDLRYVTPEDYALYVNKDSEKVRQRQMEVSLDDLRRNGTPPADESAWKKQFLAEIPLGWVEQRLAFLPDGKYGKWLRKQNAVVRINDAIFLHGGIGPKYAAKTIKDINLKIRAELAAPLMPLDSFSQDQDGPLWYRGLALEPDENPDMLRHVNRVLEMHGVRHIVIGHTPGPAVLPRFGGRVIAADVGLAEVMGGSQAYLAIEEGKYFAMHRGQKLVLPVDGEDLGGYLRAAAALEPQGSRLRVYVQNRN